MISEDELVARIEGLEVTRLRHWVELGWIVPLRSDHDLVFDDHDAIRAQLICDLVHDVAIEEESLPVVLSLLDQLHGTRRMLRAMSSAIEKQNNAVRLAILAEMKASGLIPERTPAAKASDESSKK